MAEERKPLLEEETDCGDFGPRQHITSLYGDENALSRYRAQGEGGLINLGGSGSAHSSQQGDHIVAIFVVAFDTKAGNIIEWCLPEEMELEGVEFKAMASGSHTLLTDFVYFRKDGLYGLSCFENMPVESEVERGARMKSVGILATSHTLLYRHMQFLQLQVRKLLDFREGSLDNRHQLETPGKYSQLSAFYEDKKGVLPTSQSSQSITHLSPATTPSTELPPEVRVSHPAGCFTQFVKFFAERVFTLWKFSLLQKRILFFSPPPIGVVCYRVYCCCCLGDYSLENKLSEQTIVPHFYVNVADIETIETEMAYIACTTEKIFETKTHLYDVYVDNQNLTTKSQVLQELLRVTDADRNKLQRLNNHRSALLYEAEESGQDIDEEEIFCTFFCELNNRLFQTLLDISVSQDKTLTSEHMKSMGLDPVGDRAFLMELVEHYGIDVMLMVDNPCCPR